MSAVALVTGATTGIGRAIAFALAGEGYRLGVCARSAGPLEALVAELRGTGVEAAGLPADVGDERAVSRLVAHVTEALGPVHTLVNNAGIGIFKPLGDLSAEEWDRTQSTNVRSLFLMTRAVLPGMRAAGAGAVVNIASLAGRNGFSGGTAYCASKHAVLGFSRALMQEVRHDGIRVIAVCPGSVDTPFRSARHRSRPDPETILHADDVAATVMAALRLPPRALISEIDLRPASPPRP